MKNLAIAAAVAVLLAVAASNCAPHGVEPVHNLDAATAGEAITADTHASARGFHIAGDGAFAAPCYTVVPAAPPDADGDHFPDTAATITYTNCVEGASVYSGHEIVTDGNTSSASFDFTNVIDLQVAIASSGETYSIAGTQTGSQSSGGVFTLDDAESVDGTITGGSGFNGTWHDNHTWNVVFHPDDGTWIPAPGLPLENGDLTVSGAWSLDLHPAGGGTASGAGASSGTFRTAATCPTAIVSGSAQVILSDGRILTVTWTGCGVTQTQLTTF